MLARLILSCGLCYDKPFEVALTPDAYADMVQHLKTQHGLTFVPATLNEMVSWKGRP